MTDKDARPASPDSVPPPPVVVQRQLADAMPIVVWTNDAAGQTTYLNATWSEYTGVSREESLRRGVRSFVHPDDLDAVEHRAREARDQGKDGYETTYRLLRHDGAYRWHLARVRPVYESQGREGTGEGRVISWVGTAMDVDDARREKDEQRFLAEASKVLGASLDPATTLNDVARMLVPTLADWCAIHLVDGSGALQRMAVAHVDPSKVALAWELWRRMPPQPTDPGGAYGVLRTQVAELQREDPDPMLAQGIPDPDLLALFRSLSLRSWIIVPLVAHERPLGTLTFVFAESRRIYGDRDVVFAAGLATRIAIALDNARLYEAATHARAAAEALAADVVEQARAVEEALQAMRTERDTALARVADLEKARGPR